MLLGVVAADRRGARGDGSDQVVDRAGLGDDPTLLAGGPLQVPAELRERGAAPVDRRQVRLQVLAPVGGEVGDVAPDLVELDRA
jgi:hypothetical protein